MHDIIGNFFYVTLLIQQPQQQQHTMAQPQDSFFRPIGHVVQGDADEPGTHGSSEPRMVEEVESLCMRCHDNGVTRLLLTYIPYFKEVIIASFQCDHCGERNNEIQSAGEIQGTRRTLAQLLLPVRRQLG